MRLQINGSRDSTQNFDSNDNFPSIRKFSQTLSYGEPKSTSPIFMLEISYHLVAAEGVKVVINLSLALLAKTLFLFIYHLASLPTGSHRMTLSPFPATVVPSGIDK